MNWEILTKSGQEVEIIKGKNLHQILVRERRTHDEAWAHLTLPELVKLGAIIQGLIAELQGEQDASSDINDMHRDREKGYPM